MNTVYDKQYFDEPGISNYTKYPDVNISANLKTKAQQIRDMFPHVNKILDVGCAKGVLVAELCALRFDAYGTDISLYAVSCCIAEAEGRVEVSDLTMPLPFADNEFDLVVSVDVLEHVSEESIPLALLELKRIAKEGCHWITFGDHTGQHGDETHVTMHEKGWWINKFVKSGCTATSSAEQSDVITIKKS